MRSSTLAHVIENAPLAPLTTLGVGGPARWLYPVQTAEQVHRALEFARERAVPSWVLAGGSNCIIADGGLPGVVLQPTVMDGSSGIHELTLGQVRVAAGVPWGRLVAWTVERGWQGLEALAGIPGQVGAAPIQNIGAYGQEVADVIEWVEGYQVAEGGPRSWSRDHCQFGYRDSRFKRLAGEVVVTAVVMRLHPGAPGTVAYDQLAKALAERGIRQPTLGQISDTVVQLRRSKGMVVDPADADSRSCGSFFTNPLVDTATAETALQRLARRGEAPPAWPQSDGRIKLSAAWLIERSGWQRGASQGRVGLSSKHSLAIVNKGGATAREVLAFAGLIADSVADCSGVRLEREPVLLGAA
jgi:UDP-N-acetylmuramate dehydrogenase